MRSEYEKAYKKGKKEFQRQIVEGHYPYLPALDEFLEGQGRLPEVSVGLHEIPLSMIVGTRTRGRQEAFAANFMPILDEDTEFALKWSRLYDIHMTEGIRDPVTVYEYMWNFYTLEGNKRVSVLKYLEMPDILADVTRIIPENRDDKDARIYSEFLAFFESTHSYALRFSEEGSYKKLARELGQTLGEPWPEEVLENLRSAFQTFSASFEAKKSSGIYLGEITAADAFLTYIRIYHPESLLNDTKKEIDQKVSRIWSEFRVESVSTGIDFVEDPDPGEKNESRGLLAPLFHKHAYSVDDPLRIAFIYERNAEESRWTYAHELGRNQVSEAYGDLVKTSAYSDCSTEEEFQGAVDAAVKEKNDVIITVDASQMEMTKRAAVTYPDVKFLNCSINLPTNQVRTYYGRMYEAKFLMGTLAASLADDHKVGYLAGYPVFGAIASINAFAIGAAMVDPCVRVYLSWSSQKDTDWRDVFRKEDVRVISGPDMIRPKEKGSKEYGLYKILEDGNIENIAVPVWNWGRYYELIVETILNDNWPGKDEKRMHALNFWWGMSSGVIDVILSKKLSYYSRKMIEAIRRQLSSGSLHPFNGEIHSQTGVIRPEGNMERLSNEEIVRMNWLNDNIIGRIPETKELTDTGKKAAEASGVLE